MLSREDFYNVIKITTLTSVDLVLECNNKILCGLRNNNPAKGFWFVPGSRTYKNELLRDAINRVGLTELGLDLSQKEFHSLGAYDHIYPNNFIDSEFETHYVANGFHTFINETEVENLKEDSQHSNFVLIDKEELLMREHVHDNTKAYVIDLLNHQHKMRKI